MLHPKMAPFIRQSLTRSVIKTLIKSTVVPIDYNETINKLTDRFRSAITSTTGGSSDGPLIPLPKDELPPPHSGGTGGHNGRSNHRPLTDVDIEAAINPLFDYFDVNQATLSSTLSLGSLQAVMTKTWKEILTVLEGLLIPPLSASPTDMVPLTDQEVDIVMKWREVSHDEDRTRHPSSGWTGLVFRSIVKPTVLFPSFRPPCSNSSSATTSTLKATKRDSQKKRCTTKSTTSSCPSGSITTGRRA